MMRRTSSRESGVEAKREGENKEEKLFKTGSTSSRQWAGGLRNPRIVRVSRSFGGKDRHSKVCTIRGLRDRRIRLSVPTAIQLYDLQDRLGLTQPSKVIDWLLDATQLDIDKLPPLQIPQGFAHQFQQDHSTSPLFDPATTYSLSNNNKHTADMDREEQSMAEPGYRWDIMDAKGKFLGTRSSPSQQEEEEEDMNMSSSGDHGTNLFPIGNHSTYYPNLSLSQYGLENNPLNGAAAHHFLPSAQLFFCPPPAAMIPQHRIKSSYFNPTQAESRPQPHRE